MKEKILIVEDDKEFREFIKMTLDLHNYQVIAAENGNEALTLCEADTPDLIISDISMPEMDGFKFLEAVRSREKGEMIPFLFLTAYTQESNMRQASLLAVDDYLFKPFKMQELLDVVRVRLDRRQAMQSFDTHKAHLQTVLMLANTIEARDTYTRGHVERVRDIALIFGKHLGWKQSSLAMLEFGAILHDIGKIAISSETLNKEGKLNAEEWAEMRDHPEAGAKMLKEIDHLKFTIPFVLYHHEKWDGSGYPQGLKEKNIPIEGRVMALADFYDAVTSTRSYHKKKSKEEALKMIEERSGSHFDPILVEKFLAIAEQLPG